MDLKALFKAGKRNLELMRRLLSTYSLNEAGHNWLLLFLCTMTCLEIHLKRYIFFSEKSYIFALKKKNKRRKFFCLKERSAYSILKFRQYGPDIGAF